jgi:hypothetical protein
MKTKTQLLSWSCLWVALVEGLLAALVLMAAGERRTPMGVGWLIFPIVLALVGNFPGYALAHSLNLFATLSPWYNGSPPGVDLFNSYVGFHPFSGWIVVFVVGALCWVALVWSIQLAIRAGRTSSCKIKS